MPTKIFRVTTTLDKHLYTWLKKESKRRGISLSRLAGEILLEEYKRAEDIYWAKEGEERLETFDPRKAHDHDDVWRNGG